MAENLSVISIRRGLYSRAESGVAAGGAGAGGRRRDAGKSGDWIQAGCAGAGLGSDLYRAGQAVERTREQAERFISASKVSPQRLPIDAAAVAVERQLNTA